MGTMDFPDVHSAVALQMFLVVQSEKRHVTPVQKLREDKQGGSLVLHQNQGNFFCKKQVITPCSSQENQVTVDVQNSTSTQQLFNQLSSEEGTYVYTVEIHSNNSTPQLFKKFSSDEENRVTVDVHNSTFTQRLFDKLFSEEVNGKNRPHPPGVKDQHAYPWDKSCLKSMPLDLEQFEKVDAYAKKTFLQTLKYLPENNQAQRAPTTPNNETFITNEDNTLLSNILKLQVNTKSSVEELMQALLPVAHTDLEKVRAIWIWITHHIEYDVVGYFNKEKRFCNPQDVLQNGKGVCAAYANLFEEMCRIAGVHCMNLSGHAKGYSYKIGQTFKGDSNHAWNAVYLDGQWHLVDSTWGSGLADECCSKFIFCYNEFYFLTHPALFINDHFPGNKNWQLLKPTMALKQYENNLRYSSDFYMIGMLAAHPETSIIQTVNGKVTIEVESRSPVLFMSKLKGAKEYSLMTLKKNGMKLELYPQEMGSHKLQIFAKLPKGPEDVYTSVLEYKIECSSIDRNVCFPKKLNQPVGPNWFTEKQGFLRPSQKGPVIHTNDGCCNLSFILNKDLNISASLESDKVNFSEDERRRHILFQQQENQINFKIHLPHAGNFAFQIFAKEKSDPGYYSYIFNYLICCPNTDVKWPMFPLKYSTWAVSYELVEPLAAFLPANCNIQFKLKLHSIAEAFVRCEKRCPLSLSKDGYWEGSCSTSGCREIYVDVMENANCGFYTPVLKYEVESQ